MNADMITTVLGMSLGAAEKLTLVTLAHLCDEQGQVQISYPALAQATSISERQLYRITAGLVEARLLCITPRQGRRATIFDLTPLRCARPDMVATQQTYPDIVAGQAPLDPDMMAGRESRRGDIVAGQGAARPDTMAGQEGTPYSCLTHETTSHVCAHDTSPGMTAGQPPPTSAGQRRATRPRQWAQAKTTPRSATAPPRAVSTVQRVVNTWLEAQGLGPDDCADYGRCCHDAVPLARWVDAGRLTLDDVAAWVRAKRDEQKDFAVPKPDYYGLKPCAQKIMAYLAARRPAVTQTEPDRVGEPEWVDSYYLHVREHRPSGYMEPVAPRPEVDWTPAYVDVARWMEAAAAAGVDLSAWWQHYHEAGTCRAGCPYCAAAGGVGSAA